MAKAQEPITDEYSELAQYLKEKRLNKRLTRQKVAQSLRLPEETIAQLESHKSRDLPQSNILGLYKRYGSVLNVEPSFIEDKLNDTQFVKTKNHFRARPQKTKIKHTYIMSRAAVASLVLSVIAVLLAYGLWQLFILVNAPGIEVSYPPNNSRVNEADITVTGKVASDSTVLLNGEPAPVNDDGSFAVPLYLQPGYNQLSVTAVNNFSREKTVERTVFFESN